MYDSNVLVAPVDDLVQEIAQGRLFSETNPEPLEARILEIAMTYERGVTTVMSHMARIIRNAGLFDAEQRSRLLDWLYVRGVGSRVPELVRF